MLKRIAFVLVVCTCVSVAFGAAVRIPTLIPWNGENELADGMAILNYASGQDKTIVQIIMSDFTPLTTYDLQLGSVFRSGAITTDENGHATFHFEYPLGDISSSDVRLGFNINGNLTIEDDELRALGDNPNS